MRLDMEGDPIRGGWGGFEGSSFYLPLPSLFHPLQPVPGKIVKKKAVRASPAAEGKTVPLNMQKGRF